MWVNIIHYVGILSFSVLVSQFLNVSNSQTYMSCRCVFLVVFLLDSKIFQKLLYFFFCLISHYKITQTGWVIEIISINFLTFLDAGMLANGSEGPEFLQGPGASMCCRLLPLL